jgi:hypothetical protein
MGHGSNVSATGTSPPPAPLGHIVSRSCTLAKLCAGLVLLATVGAIVCPAAFAGDALSWSRPIAIDDDAPFGNSWRIEGVSCVSVSLCVAVDRVGNVLTSTDPGAGASAIWTTKQADPPREITAVSCASSSLCLGVTKHSEVVSSTDPARGAGARWTHQQVDGPEEGLLGVSCPSSSLCVAVGAGSHGVLVTSAHPSRGSRATWTTTRFHRGITLLGVSCPTSSLCVAVDRQGDVLVSTDPRRGADASWSFEHIDSQELKDISCPSRSLCVALDEAGEFVSSTDPAAGVRASWTIDSQLKYQFPEQPMGISCPSVSLCVAAGLGGRLTTSVDPALGSRANWAVRSVGSGSFLTGVSCVPSLCVAIRGDGRIISSSDPSAGSGTSWTSVDADGYTPLLDVSCVSTLCMAIDDRGDVLSSSDPEAGSHSSWKMQHIPGAEYLTAISCASSTLCAVVDARGKVFISTDPSLGAAAFWGSSDIGQGMLDGISCSASLCAAIDDSGDVLTTEDPARGAEAIWADRKIDPSGEFLNAVTCVSGSYCVVGDNQGFGYISEDPGAGASSHWTRKPIDSAGEGNLSGASCVAGGLCLTIDAATEQVIGTTNAGVGPAPRWYRSRVFPPPLPAPEHEGDGISCASVNLCVAFDNRGRVAESSDPLRGSRARWHVTRVDHPTLSRDTRASGLSAVSCGSRSLCVAVDWEGQALIGKRSAPHTSTATQSLHSRMSHNAL